MWLNKEEGGERRRKRGERREDRVSFIFKFDSLSFQFLLLGQLLHLEMSLTSPIEIERFSQFICGTVEPNYMDEIYNV